MTTHHATTPPTPYVRPDIFTRISRWTIHATGGRWGFFTAAGVILFWAAAGPYYHYSDYWQLVINTGTTIVTFLMVFLIQNAQNRESKAVHLKLDELIRAVKTARNEMIDIENLTEEHLDRLAVRYHQLAAVHRDLEARGKAVHPLDCHHTANVMDSPSHDA
jgi:low affinity Fe/Cu permease